MCNGNIGKPLVVYLLFYFYNFFISYLNFYYLLLEKCIYGKVTILVFYFFVIKSLVI